jgi:hypothetical protein
MEISMEVPMRPMMFLVINFLIGATAVASVPDCLNSNVNHPGVYEVTVDLTNLSVKNVFDVLSLASNDPMWPVGEVMTNAENLSRTKDTLNFKVAVNKHRIVFGATWEAMRSSIESAMGKIASQPGVTVTCIQDGD